MSLFTIEWKRSALKELKCLPKAEVTRIRTAVEGLRFDPFPAGSRKLAGVEDAYRIREGSYRVVYTVAASRLVIEVIRVGHRKDIYRK
jgi:mRNA interferase RelE/StbE